MKTATISEYRALNDDIATRKMFASCYLARIKELVIQLPTINDLDELDKTKADMDKLAAALEESVSAIIAAEKKKAEMEKVLFKPATV